MQILLGQAESGHDFAAGRGVTKNGRLTNSVEGYEFRRTLTGHEQRVDETEQQRRGHGHRVVV